MNITVIGLGLIGGSLAWDLKSQLQVHVTGVDANIQHQEIALKLGLVHEILELECAISKANCILIAVPVDIIETILPIILENMASTATVIDVGSTKTAICKSIAHHPLRNRFVAVHPLAGTEYSGPAAAQKGLFLSKKNIICESEKSDVDALSMAIKVFESIGMTTYFMTAEEHDRHLAYVSHLSHVSAFMLGLTVLDIERDEKQIFDLASTGFASTVRLAKSNPETWAAIFYKNKDYTLEALDSYIAHLQQFRSCIALDDVQAMQLLMIKSNAIKRILK